MSTTYRYQQEFANELTQKWLDGKHEYVRITIRQLKNKAQAAYIAARVAFLLQTHHGESGAAEAFVEFIHPNL